MRVVVDVVLKPEILDPQGQAIVGALARLGIDGVTRRAAGQALRARRGRQRRRRHARPDGRHAAGQPRHRELHHPPRLRRVLGAGSRWRGRALGSLSTCRRALVWSPFLAASTIATPRARCASPAPRPVPLWHADPALHGVDAVVLPGGFSYGDYLRCGAIARFAPVMDSVIEAAADGLPVLGICNGFQVLCEAHLLPGALIRNDRPQVRLPRPAAAGRERGHARGRRTYRPVRRSSSRSRTATGGYVADERTLDELEAEGRVVARYSAQSQRQLPRHRRHQQRRRQRRRPDAAPRARGRRAHRPGHRRSGLLPRLRRRGHRVRRGAGMTVAA